VSVYTNIDETGVFIPFEFEDSIVHQCAVKHPSISKSFTLKPLLLFYERFAPHLKVVAVEKVVLGAIRGVEILRMPISSAFLLLIAKAQRRSRVRG
jgi:hypothetical protein